LRFALEESQFDQVRVQRPPTENVPLLRRRKIVVIKHVLGTRVIRGGTAYRSRPVLNAPRPERPFDPFQLPRPHVRRPYGCWRPSRLNPAVCRDRPHLAEGNANPGAERRRRPRLPKEMSTQPATTCRRNLSIPSTARYTEQNVAQNAASNRACALFPKSWRSAPACKSRPAHHREIQTGSAQCEVHHPVPSSIAVRCWSPAASSPPDRKAGRERRSSRP
jgi:hypothetical protein